MASKAGEIMVREVICVQDDMDLRDVAKLFLSRGITGAPVLDKNSDLVGVISQRDVLFYNLTRDDELTVETDFYHQVRVEGHHLGAGYQIEDTNTGRVSDAMTPVVHAVSAAASLEAVASLMIRKHVHRVIVRKGKKVAGIISALELLRVMSRSGSGKASRGAAEATVKARAKSAGKSAPKSSSGSKSKSAARSRVTVKIAASRKPKARTKAK